MKNFIWACSLLFVVGCAGSAGDLVSDNGRAELLDDSFIDANGNEIEDENTPIANGGSNGNGDSNGNGGSDNGNSNPNEGTSPDETETTPDGENLCINESDAAVLQSEDPDFDDLISSCTETCFSNQSNNENCIGDCLTDASDISSGCAQCYNAAMTCYFEDCFSICAEENDSEENDGEECNSCLAENCFAPFLACSGINPDDF